MPKPSVLHRVLYGPHLHGERGVKKGKEKGTGKIKETDQLAYEETAKTLELYSLPKRGYRVNAIQFYQTAERLNRVNTADTAMLQLQDKQ